MDVYQFKTRTGETIKFIQREDSGITMISSPVVIIYKDKIPEFLRGIKVAFADYFSLSILHDCEICKRKIEIPVGFKGTITCKNCDLFIGTEKAGTQAVEGGWISVEDRLPEEKGYYWTYPFYSLKFDIDKKTWSDNYDTDIRVTHWQPLPQKPE